MVVVPKRIVVLYGGQSAEHEVSCISAFTVARAALAAGYDLRLIGITTEGLWIDTTEPAVRTLTGGAGPGALASPDTLVPSALDADLRAGRAELISGEAAPSEVVVFPLLHGPMGEDGTVQGLLELAGVAYVGAGVAASATAMDKGLAKQALAAAGVPQVRYLVRREQDIDDMLAKSVESELGWPVFVKPANLGSSVGISRVAGSDDLPSALELALRYDEYIVIEEAVTAREIEVGVLGWPELRVSVAGEIVATHQFYDFDDKYLSGSAQLRIPADLPDSVEAALPSLALAACRALRVDGMARVDFFYETTGRGLLVNEVNTIPGFTPGSMYPQLWAASGMPIEELLSALIEQAVQRQRRRSRFERHRP